MNSNVDCSQKIRQESCTAEPISTLMGCSSEYHSSDRVSDRLETLVCMGISAQKHLEWYQMCLQKRCFKGDVDTDLLTLILSVEWHNISLRSSAFWMKHQRMNRQQEGFVVGWKREGMHRRSRCLLEGGGSQLKHFLQWPAKPFQCSVLL